MKFFILTILLFSASYASSQNIRFAPGLSYSSNLPSFPFNVLSAQGTIYSEDTLLMIGIEAGGFFPKQDLFPNQWSGRMLNFGFITGIHFRGGKTYQPGFTCELESFLLFKEDPGSFTQLNNDILIEEDRFLGIPFSFSPKFTNTFWIRNVALTLSLGYRNYQRKFSSPGISKFYRTLHSLESSVSLRYLL